MTDPVEHARRIASEIVGLPVSRASRGIGYMLTLDFGDWNEPLGRGHRSLWLTGSVWRLEVGRRFVADAVTSTDAEIDAALPWLIGKTVEAETVDEDGGIAILGDGWALRAFAVRSDTDNWVLFDDTDRSAFCGPNGVLGSDEHEA